MGNRSRLFLADNAEAGQGESIAISKVLPYNATLLQATFVLSANATTAGDIDVMRTIASLSRDVTVRSIDPVSGDLELICPHSTQFQRGDTVACAYANPNDIDVSVELVFEEAT